MKVGGETYPIGLVWQCKDPATGEIDLKKLDRLKKELDDNSRRAFLISAVEDEAAVAEAVGAHPANQRSRKPKLTQVEDPAPLNRGPWVLEVTGLGRPLTFNAERASSMSAGTMAKVRKAEREWVEAVEQQARAAGIPPLKRAFVVVQPFYPDNRVPDVDALPSAMKASLDGMVRAAVLPGDRREQLPFGYTTLPPVTDGGEPRLTVTVFPLP